MLETDFDVPVLFHRHFDVIRATNPSLLREAYRLRYQVYCVENSFEDPEQHSSGCESDGDDDRSIHTLLLHRRSGEIAGTSRVILPDQRGVRPLPIATLLDGSDRRRFDGFPVAAEMSRFAVSKQFRRRCGEQRYADSGFGEASVVETERRLMRFISIGLIRGLFGICVEYSVTHLTAVVEPPLLRILHRLGLKFVPIGGMVMHHGLRQPCFLLLEDLIRHSRENDTVVWQYALEPELREHTKVRRYAAA